VTGDQLTEKKSAAGTDGGENKYYIGISERCKTVKYIVLVILVVFILTMISVCKDDITVENFQYLIKFLDTEKNEYDGSSRTIIYSSSENMRFGVYKGDLVTAKNYTVDMYNFTGAVTMTDDVVYGDPVLLTSDKYMLVYDLGGTSFTLYNAFSRLYSETFDYALTNAAVSDSGMFAIVTKTLEYRSAVYIYDKDFNKITQIMKDKYVMSVDIADDGSKILVVSASSNSDGDFYTEIMSVEPYSEKESTHTIVTDAMPLAAAYNKNNGYTVLCDNRLLFYSEDGSLESEYGFGGRIPTSFDMSGEYTVISFNKNLVGYDNDIMVFNAEGKLVLNTIIEGRITRMRTDSGCLFVLLGNSLVRVDIENGKKDTLDIEKNCSDIVPVDESRFMLCYTEKTYVMYMDDAFGNSNDTADSENVG